MMRSLFSGVSGLKVHQTKMDVIGNNIANVNTVGFKGSTVNFSDVFYQTTQGASAPNDETGMAGRNAMQIGLGSNLASVTANIGGQGGAQRTDNPFDVMINGDGFFIVNSGGTNYFTKAGAFNVDADGNLCTPTGAYVMGWQTSTDGLDIVKDAVSPLRVMSPENMYADPEATSAANVSGNIDRLGSDVTGEGAKVQISFFDALGAKYTAQFKVKQQPDPNTRLYTVSLSDIIDPKGDSIFVTKTTDPATGNVTYAKKVSLTDITFGEHKYTIDGDVDPATGEFSLTYDGTDGEPTLAFDTKGHFQEIDSNGYDPANLTGNKTIAFKVNTTSTGDADPFSNITIDFSSITQFDAGQGKANLESAMGALDGSGKGKKVGNMIEISIDQAGKITGTYDNGDKKLLGQIAVARFANPSGMEAVGNNMFAETQNSGGFDGIGQDPSSEGDSLSTGQLEMSNVDLSSEFTSMITTQRGFQANSRIITTSDTMLEELINLKR